MSGPAESSPLRFADLDARIRESVQGVAASAADPRDPLRGLYITDEEALSLTVDGPPARVEERLAELATLLGLDGLEQAVLAVCAAPEISWRYGRLYGYLHDDVSRQLATPRLASALLAGGTVAGEDVLERLAADATLRRIGAIRLLDEPRLALADRPLKCADPMAAVLIGGALADSRPPACELVAVPALPPASEAAIDELASTITAGGELTLAVAGPDAPAALARALGRPLLLASAAGLEDPERLRSLRLAAALAQRALVFDGLEHVAPEQREAVWRALREGPERALVCVESTGGADVFGSEPVHLLRIPALGLPERRAVWSALLGRGPVDDVSVKFRLSMTQIEHAAEIARTRARARGDVALTADDLDHGARGASRHGLGGLASRVEGESGWESLVLPERSLGALRTIASFLRHRDRVLLEWGGAGPPRAAAGLTVLFAGESGTGKTMAAQVVARDLGLDLFRIDLATVVSKYIGETEKNLDRIFAAAEGSNAVLLFDEADALFGKRSEVRDAHDRYANVEVAYLLQRIEGYAGAVILTTNLRHNIDAGFLRRLDLVVDFPFPEPHERERLWQRLLPAEAHRRESDIEIPFLAARFKLAGGSIRNAALAAALLAAEEGAPIAMAHVVRAVALEYDKLGRLTLEADFERFYSATQTTGSGARGDAGSPMAGRGAG
jgi:ATPase family protein associated with various cellular activities (AAA)/winged helix domain-containing protein